MSTILHQCTDPAARIQLRGDHLVITGAAPGARLVEWQAGPPIHAVVIDMDSGWAIYEDRPLVLAAIAGEIEARSEARAAYRPASECLGDSVKTYKGLRAILDREIWIRTMRPNPKRLKVHMGDWAEYQRRRNVAAFAQDRPALVFDCFAASSQDRLEETHREKELRKTL
jgi:hypothetical protein